MNVRGLIAVACVVALAGACSSSAASPPTSHTPTADAAASRPAGTATRAPTPTTEPTSPASAIARATGWVACQCGLPPRETLFLLHADGSDEHQILTGVSGDVRHPDFSHDGRRLAFDRLATEQGADEVWLAKADGTDPTRIETTCPIDDCLGFWEPAWSPDDTELAIVIEGGPFANGDIASNAIAIVDVASGRTRMVTQQAEAKGQLHFPRWSPDGKRLVFWSESDTPSVWVVGIDGKGLRQLTQADLLAGDPDWSPDGTRIVVSTRPILHFPGGATDLYTIAPDGTDLMKLTDSAGTSVRFGQPRWSPDGTALLYTHVVERPKIWAMALDGSRDGPIGADTEFQTHPVLQATH